MARVYLLLTLAAAFLLGAPAAKAQLSNPLSNRVINYKTVVDDPYDLNQLWVNLSPMAFHIGSDNISLGYGVSARLMVKDKLQFTGGLMTSYGQATDYMYNQARNNAGISYRPAGEHHDAQAREVNIFIPFSATELGAQFAIKDVEKRSTSRIMLTSKKVRVMEFSNVDEITVNSRNRHLFSSRLGVQSFASTVYLSRALERQNLSLSLPEGGTQLAPNGQTVTGTQASLPYHNQLFSNLRMGTVYVGGSYQMIRNVAVKADKFGNLANNIIVSTFADVIVAPAPSLDDVRIARPGGTGYDVFSTKDVAIRHVGFRTGADVSYNQDLHYSFGGEIGVRPGLKGQGFYVAARLSFPALAFRLKRSRLANQVN